MKLSDNVAVVLGLFETGLAVGRSLGRAGVRVVGLDFHKTIGFYSKYIDAMICPDPLECEGEFIAFLVELSKNQKQKPVLFVAADEFLIAVSRNRKCLQEHYLMNIPECHIVESITDKLKQHELCAKARVSVPQTFIAHDMQEVHKIKDDLPYPVFVKGREVTSWRKVVNKKGFLVRTSEELLDTFSLLFERGADGLIQEVIPGPDTNHFKVCCYISREGNVLLALALQKLRQQPIGFGFGCVVQSVYYPQLLELGKNFLTTIKYRGVGSVEFKLDARTGELRLIELNPRYWQQNGLAEKCGMNFPLVNFLDLTGATQDPAVNYLDGIKWVNVYCDLKSFLGYRARGELSLTEWLHSLRGPKVYSDHALDDIYPSFYEVTSHKVLSRSVSFAVENVKRWFT